MVVVVDGLVDVELLVGLVVEVELVVGLVDVELVELVVELDGVEVVELVVGLVELVVGLVELVGVGVVKCFTSSSCSPIKAVLPNLK